MRRPTVSAAFVLVFLFALVGHAVRSVQPPRPLPASADSKLFSAERAFRHVAAAFTEPHPAGTPAHRRVFEYILATLREMGVTPEVQDTTAVRALPGVHPSLGANVAHVRNILVRVPGQASAKALLFMAHYDSVIWGPGAADDGSGCAVLIETLRALLAGPRLANDVIFLFADAEESGLMGAHAFAREHPWMRDVGLVFNFDVRGVSGPSYMFETGPHNGWLIPHFARACSRPLANSLMADIYYRMGLNSDFTVFRKLGLPGLNFAFIRGIAYYHTANDTPAHLDLGSLQHQGNYALELARYFGNLAIAPPSTGNAIYFNPLGSYLISYPASWAVPLALVTLAWLVAVSNLGMARGRVSPRGISGGAAGFLGCVVAAVTAALLATLLAWRWRRYYMVYDDALFLVLAAAVTLAAFTGLLNWLVRRIRWEEAFLGAIYVWAVLLIGSVLALPGASFGFQWPLAFALLGLTGEFVFGGVRPGSPVLLFWRALCAAPVLSFGVLAACILHDGITAVLAPITMLWVALLLGLLIPLLTVVRDRSPFLLPAISGVMAALAISMVALKASGEPSPTRPEIVSLSYALNADTGQAFWLSRSEKLNSFEQRFFPSSTARGRVAEFRPRDLAIYAKHPAAALKLEPAQCDILSDSVTGTTRRLRLRLRSPRNAPRLEIHLNPETQVLSSSVNGKPYAAGRPWWFEFHGFGDRAAELALELPAAARPVLAVIEYSPELPELPGFGPVSLPPGFILEPNTTGWGRGLRSGWTLVRRTFTLAR